MAAQLRRYWDQSPLALSMFQPNQATDNAGIHLFAAFAGAIISPETAGKLYVAITPALLIFSVHRCLRILKLPIERIFVLIPICLGFCFSWGFSNFAMGSAIAWFVISLVLEQRNEHSWFRLFFICVISMALSVVHVLAMLGLAIVSASIGLEYLLRKRPPSLNDFFRILAIGLSLLPGCLYDLWVTRSHVAADASSYAQASPFFSPNPIYKLLYLGTFCGGLWGTYLDTALAWLLLITLIAAAFSARKNASLFALPWAVITLLYLAIPPVLGGTHQVYPRIASWLVVACILAIPANTYASSGSPTLEPKLTRWWISAAFASVAVTITHLIWFSVETAGLNNALASIPQGSKTTSLIEAPRSASVRQAVLTHVIALHSARYAGTDLFSFSRYKAVPLVFQPHAVPPYPEPSWEWNSLAYEASSSAATQFPWVLLRTSEAEEGEEQRIFRIFGNTPVELVFAENRWRVYHLRPPEAHEK